MIISYKRRFTFIHCPKTAGTSVAVYLASHLGPRDLQLGAWVECIEHGIRPNLRFYLDVLAPTSLLRIPRQIWRSQHISVIEAMNEVQKRRYHTSIGAAPHHPTADQIRDFDPTAWKTHFKFCFVRNPYDQVVSLYRWMERARRAYGMPSQTFLGCLLEIKETGKINAINAIPSRMYLLNGKVCVDFIGKFERFKDDMRSLSECLALPADVRITHEKRNPQKGSYRDWYTAREKALVESIFADEFERFGYSF